MKNIYRIFDLFLPVLTLFLLNLGLNNSVCNSHETIFALLAGALFVLGKQLLSGYDSYSNRTIAKKLEVTTKSWLLAVVILVSVDYLFYVLNVFDNALFLLWFIATPILLFVSKIYIYRIYLKKFQKDFVWILVGQEYEFLELEKTRLAVNNIVIHQCPQCTIDELKEAVKQHRPSGILMNNNEKVSPEMVKLLTHFELSGIKLLSMEHFFESFLRKCFIPYDVYGTNYLDQVRRLKGFKRTEKRVLDVSFSLFLIALTFPVMLYSLYKIRKESPGKILFQQERVGLDAKTFKVMKFRTMHEDSHFDPYTQKDDPRVFKYGNFMRKSRVDELPQMFNVLRGDMHFCGPRTEWNILVEKYEDEIPFYHVRHLVKPGITGWAQVMYPYGANTEDARQKLMYDLYYIKHWSIWLDIEVLIRTVNVILGKKGI